MGAIRLDCPVCGAEFLKTNRLSKTCSHDCSRKLRNRQTGLGKYRAENVILDRLRLAWMRDVLNRAIADYQ